MKRVTRKRRLTEEEAEKYRKIRDQIKEELPELIQRHNARVDDGHTQVACESCGKSVSKEGNYCHGCNRYICAKCCDICDHFLAGKHSLLKTLTDSSSSQEKQ